MIRRFRYRKLQNRYNLKFTEILSVILLLNISISFDTTFVNVNPFRKFYLYFHIIRFRNFIISERETILKGKNELEKFVRIGVIIKFARIIIFPLHFWRRDSIHQISSISFARRKVRIFSNRPTGRERKRERETRFCLGFRLSGFRRIDTGTTGCARLIRESKLSCIIHGRAFALTLLLPPPPCFATRRLLNRKLLEFPSRREIYRAYGIYVAEKTPRFTPPSCLPPPPSPPSANKNRGHVPRQIYFSPPFPLFFFSLFLSLF